MSAICELIGLKITLQDKKLVHEENNRSFLTKDIFG